MGKVSNNGISHLISSKEEFVKQYVVLDAQSRPSIILLAPVNARVGDPCPATAYKYFSATDSTVIARAEAVGIWRQLYEDEYVLLRNAIEAL